MVTEGIEVRSVGNTLMLHETALIEACNLKAAIEYKLKDCKKVELIRNSGKFLQRNNLSHILVAAAGEALTDMPPRSESELDPVTLHNQALINFEADPTGGSKANLFLTSLQSILKNLSFSSQKKPKVSYAAITSSGFAKLQYLLTQNPFPPETFSNLLLLYCKYEVRILMSLWPGSPH